MINTPRASGLVLPCVAAILLGLLPAAQAQKIAWDTRQNGTAGTDMRVGGLLNASSGSRDRSKHHAVAADGSGNAYVVGQIGSSTSSDLITVGYDRRGIEKWRRTRAGSASFADCADAVAVDSAGNVYVVGYIENSGQHVDAILISYTPDGDLRWEQLVQSTYGGYTYDDNFADVVVKTGAQASLDLIYVVGTTHNPVVYGRASMFVKQYDIGGNSAWTTLLPAQDIDTYGRGIALDSSGNIYVAGVMQSGFNGIAENDFMTVKLGPAGNLIWSHVDDAPMVGAWNTPYAIAVGGSRVYVTGSTASGTSGSVEANYYTVAYDTAGNNRWARVEAGTASNGPAWDVVADASGNAYVTGGLSNPGGCYTVSYAPDGGQRWAHGTDTAGQVCYAAALDQSSNLYIVGAGTGVTRPGMLLESYTSGGDLRWRKMHRSSQDEPHALALAVSPSGGAIYAAGSSFGTGDAQFVTVYMGSAAGVEIWTARSRAATSFTVGDGKKHARHAVATDAAGNTYVVGRKWNGTNYDMFTISYDTTGTPRWEQPQDGPAGLNDWAYAVTVTSGGRVIVTGVTEASNHSLDYYTVCYAAADGGYQWDKTKNGAGNDEDVASAVVADSSGRAFVTGWSWGASSGFDFLTVAYDVTTGTELWATPADGAAHFNDQALDMTLDQSGSVYVTGLSAGSGTTAVLTVKYDPATGTPTRQAVTSRPGYNVPAAILAVGDAVYVTGSTGTGGAASCLTIKYDLSLNQVWEDVVYSQSTGDAAGRALAFDAGRNTLHVAGYGMNAAGDRDFLEIRYVDAAAPGQATFTDYSGTADTAEAVAVDPNGMVFLTGVSDDGIELRVMTAAFQPTGDHLWTHRPDVSSWNDSQGFAVAPLPGRGAVVAGGLNDSYDCMRTIAYTFATPTITAGTALARTAGGTAALSNLASISDPDEAASSLVVTAIGVPADLTVTGISIAYGWAKATVGATCSATAGAKTIVMQVRNSGYVAATANVTVNVTDNTAPVLGTYNNRTIRTGEPLTVSPSGLPTDNGTVTLNASASAGYTGSVTVSSSDGKVSIVNPGPGNAAYTITVTGTDNCGLATPPRTFILTVTGIAPPSNAHATAISTSAVHLTWDATTGAVSYDVWRSSQNSGYAPIANVPAGSGTTYDNTGLTAATTYLYYVTARNFWGDVTYRSNIDPATTILFTDDPVQAGTTVVKALHFAELRLAVNAVRAAAGLAPIGFTPPTLGGVAIASQHVTDLRSALNVALGTLVLPTLSPAYPATAGTVIHAADVTEIRNAVK